MDCIITDCIEVQTVSILYRAYITQATYENACACSLRGDDVIPACVNDWGMIILGMYCALARRKQRAD